MSFIFLKVNEHLVLQHRNTSAFNRRRFIVVVVVPRRLVVWNESSNDELHLSVRRYSGFQNPLIWILKKGLLFDSRFEMSSRFINRLIPSAHCKDSWRILNVVRICRDHSTSGRQIAFHSCCQGIYWLWAIYHVLKIFLLLFRITTLKPRHNANTSAIITVSCVNGVRVIFDLKLAVLFNF